MLWPQDLESKIVATCLASDLVPVVKDMCNQLKPVKGGSTENAFFSANESLPIVKVCKNRQVIAALPSILVPFYETYDETTEFIGSNRLTFLSEQQMLRDSQPGSVDLAYRYSGMGHIMMHTYVKKHDSVVSMLDGGANGFDRIENAAKRQEVVKKYVDDDVIETSDSWVSCRPFVQWWEEEASDFSMWNNH
jgi:hypothetical protein